MSNHNLVIKFVKLLYYTKLEVYKSSALYAFLNVFILLK